MMKEKLYVISYFHEPADSFVEGSLVNTTDSDLNCRVPPEIAGPAIQL